MPSAPGRDHEVLTVAAIYGANASGKSNLLDGLQFMSLAVRESFQSWSPEGGVPRQPFRLSPHGRLEPSIFVAEFIAGGARYTYGFSVDDCKVAEEWLYSYPEKRKRILFEREGSRVRFGTTIRQLKAKVEILEELTRDNALFLSVAVQLNLMPVMSAYRWFAHDLVVRLSEPRSAREVGRRVGAYLAQSRRGTHRRVVELLAAADTGISGLRLEQGSDPKLPQTQDWILLFNHGAEEFTIEDESAGTRNWLDFLPPVLDALDHGTTLVVDEIDSSLHPLLTEHLIQLFKDDKTNPKGAQLVFTTHDTALLGNYAIHEALERDHIWFVDKGANEQSKLYPLSDFRPRKGENTEKRYLSGSYGAVPVLSGFEFEEAMHRDKA